MMHLTCRSLRKRTAQKGPEEAFIRPARRHAAIGLGTRAHVGCFDRHYQISQ